MSAVGDSLAREKERLQTRAALCRIALRRDSSAVRDALQWKRIALNAVATPSLQRAAIASAVSLFGLRRSGRLLAFAAGALLVVKVARTAIAMARGVGGR
jgi:hypothetical protein